MSWICPKCETENPDRMKKCEVCDSPRPISPRERLIESLKEKYSNEAYKYFIPYHYDLLAKADKGEISAQYEVGERFYKHEDVKNFKIAVFWYKEAANKGYKKACLRLGSFYLFGKHNIRKNIKIALKWYYLAGENLSEFDKSKLSGDDLYAIANIYDEGYDIIPVNTSLAADYYKLAAEAGNENAQYQMGVVCGKEYHTQESYDWYQKAAYKGHAEAKKKVSKIRRKKTIEGFFLLAICVLSLLSLFSIGAALYYGGITNIWLIILIVIIIGFVLFYLD